MAGDITPSYPASEIDPSSSPSSSPARSSSRGRSLAKLWRTPGGRIMLAAGAAFVLLVFALVRREEPALDDGEGAAPIDPLKASQVDMEGSDVLAQPLPDGGFDFQDYDSSLGVDAPVPPNFIINLPGAPTPAPAKPGPSKPKPRKARGWYRSATGGAWTFHDGRGTVRSVTLSKTNAGLVATATRRMRQLRKPVTFRMGGIVHELHTSGAVHPKR